MRIAVLGINHGYAFAKHFYQMSDVELVAVAGRNDLSKQRAANLHVPIYEDYKQLILECELDGVVITLPNALHKEAVEACADKGMHILVEKPIASTVEEAKEIITYCAKRKVHLMVGHHRRFSSKIRKLKEIITSGAIGDLIAVNMLWALAKDKAYYNESWKVEKGGGPLLINGIHDIDNLRYVTGLDFLRVYASSQSKIRNNAVEDSASVMLEASNGITANYFISDGVPSPWAYELTVGENSDYRQIDKDCYHFFGTKGSLSFPSFRMYSYTGDGYGWKNELQEEKFEVKSNDPLKEEASHFIDILKGETTPLVPGEEGLKTLEVLEAIKLSINKQAVVKLNEGSYKTH
ncbi:oxidoreductase [Oceanobacillus iheyensis HTE831]|uniref:Oxidoreductase n=2 Tax=Oceanobacillus iheyensis TaxID=182710 RepID=Q8ELI7_OCEIH|nr:oxidoreductase [Oceanobacillus iheyensis HTE831]